MDSAQWPQEIVVKAMEEIVETAACSKPSSNSSSLERKIRPQKDEALNCPRCNSTNTKFCYYNNYSLSQPRYFCKTCRRYWTEGGSLRNIPVGGGSRKNKRSSSNLMSNKLPDDDQIIHPSQNPKIHEGQDLNLGFPSTNDFKTISELIHVPNNDKENMLSSSSQISALELLTGITSTGLSSSFMPMADPNTVYSSGLSFSLDGLQTNTAPETTGSSRLLFPFEDLKQVSTTSNATHHHLHQNKDQRSAESTGYWSGVLGGGTW